MSKKRIPFATGGWVNTQSSGDMTLYGADYDFSTEANDRIDIDVYTIPANGMTLGVKADSIIDELSRIIEKSVIIHFTDPSRAITITPTTRSTRANRLRCCSCRCW